MTPPADRRFVGVQLEYSLRRPDGWRSPTTQAKHWFFEIPAARDTDDGWNELLHRIFFDANGMMQRREPGDPNWLHFETGRRAPVDDARVLAWDGQSIDPFPWIPAARAVVWEPSACWFVDDAGNYDVASPHDFTELILLRLLHAGKVDEAGFVAFFDRYFPKTPGAGRGMYAERATRFANLVAVRMAPGRRPPGSKPWTSRPG